MVLVEDVYLLRDSGNRRVRWAKMAETYYALTDIVKLIDNLIAAMPTSFYNGIMAVRGGLVTAPAADVAKIVRCGECKHWFDNGTDLCSCDRDALLRRRDFFCADGERRNNG